jgi:hypothetical protein
LLHLPVPERVEGGQHPIGDTNQWQQIVDNLAPIVADLDRSFVPAIEAVSAPSPE